MNIYDLIDAAAAIDGTEAAEYEVRTRGEVTSLLRGDKTIAASSRRDSDDPLRSMADRLAQRCGDRLAQRCGDLIALRVRCVEDAERKLTEACARLHNARGLEARLRAFAEKTEDGDA